MLCIIKRMAAFRSLIGLIAMNYVCLFSLRICDADTNETISAGQYRYIGCYSDTDISGNRDMTGNEMNLSELTVGTCAAICQTAGYPYAGLGMATRCVCGDSYGNLGASYECDVECYTGEYCGGTTANDVYYSVDESLASHRGVVVHRNASTFSDARMDCVQNDGDLAAIETQQLIDYVISAVLTSDPTNASTAENMSIPAVWIGLQRRGSQGLFQWTDEKTTPYYEQAANFIIFWSPTDPQNDSCVLLNITMKKWQTASCDSLLPYVCLQLLPAPDNTTDTPPTTTTPSGSADNRPLILLIITPVFLFCLCGSFCLYGAQRVYTTCRNTGQYRLVTVKRRTKHSQRELLFPATRPTSSVAQGQTASADGGQGDVTGANGDESLSAERNITKALRSASLSRSKTTYISITIDNDETHLD